VSQEFVESSSDLQQLSRRLLLQDALRGLLQVNLPVLEKKQMLLMNTFKCLTSFNTVFKLLTLHTINIYGANLPYQLKAKNGTNELKTSYIISPKKFMYSITNSNLYKFPNRNVQ